MEELMLDSRLTMEDAVQLLHLPINKIRGSVNTTCPVCGGKHSHEKKLNINFDKGVFRCAKCAVSGGPINLWALYRGFSQDDLKEAAKDYYRYIGSGLGKTEIVKIAETPIVIEPSFEVPLLDIEERSRTYEALLNVLALSDEHRSNLHKRGLTDEIIEKNGYKTYPVAGLSVIASKLQKTGCVLKGVPGFYTYNDKWTIRKMPSGFLIPQRNGFGQIQGMQIRLDNSEEGGCRYITISTADKFTNGSKGKAYIHLRKGEKGFREIVLTEGPLKGDIISFFTGYSVLAVQGVNSVSNLDGILLQLQSKGLKRILIAFDMDANTNVNVQKALEKVKDIIATLGIAYQTLIWDPQYKGLDDYLNAARQSRKW